MQLNALKKGGINILKEYLKVLKSVETEKKLNNLFVLEVVKLNYELELKCYKQAVNTFSKILKMQDPVITPWPFLVRAAFLLGKIEELYKSYILWGIGINKLDLKDSYNKLFILYLKERHGLLDIPSLKVRQPKKDWN